MWRRSAYFVVWGLALHGPSSLAADEPARRSNLLAQQRAVQFDLVMGRVSATNLRVSAARCQTTEKTVGDRRELLTISPQRLAPTLHYEVTDAESTITVDVLNGQEVTIRATRSGAGGATHVRFEQPAKGGVILSVIKQGPTPKVPPNVPAAAFPDPPAVSASQSRVYSAPSLWHLCLMERDVCNAELVPLLALLRAQWQLAALIDAVEDSLFDVAVQGSLPDRTRVNELVAQLAHKQFKQRHAADRQLRDIGPAVIPYLEHAGRGTLDEEQQTRLQAILQSLAKVNGDTPERVAVWLSTDSAIWLTLLSHAEPEKRRLAAEHLSQLVSLPIDFDPLADDVTRATQVAAFRKQCAIR